MNEFDPTKREYINLSPLHRFEADMVYVRTYADMVLSISEYFTRAFDIPEYSIKTLFSENNDMLPSDALFDLNPDLAREQALLLLIKVALPLAENFIADDEAFTDWTLKTSRIALNLDRSNHTLEECSKVSQEEWAPHSCDHSGECPIKFTTYKLIQDATKIDHESPDYLTPWAQQKISRTIAKVEIARQLELIEPNFCNSLVHSYLRRVRRPSARNHLPLENQLYIQPCNLYNLPHTCCEIFFSCAKNN